MTRHGHTALGNSIKPHVRQNVLIPETSPYEQKPIFFAMSTTHL